jgi:Secretion system C-terminal sorting domain
MLGNVSLVNSFSMDITARYVRMQGIHRGTPYGFSIWEFEVYGKPVISTSGTGTPHIYPNPAPDHFSVVRGKDDIVDVEVFDASGRLMYKVVPEYGSTEVEVSTRGYARGIYMVNVNTLGGKYRIKVVH